ncbi:MAG TPA: UDP-glucose 4-epimerase GalE [Saprospiraceae bacterium]|nr:UDP-glucose 4-epimerase GalE [Saprospiraceae bacterium]
MKILVTGGTGYIGSHTVVDLIDNGFEVITIDNFSNSHGSQVLDRIQKITGIQVKNYQVDLKDLDKTRVVFAENPDIVGIIHFAAHIYVNDSVNFPTKYYRNNLDSLVNILDCMEEYKVKNLIFSSSCSVYGNCDALPVLENTPLGKAESPYARTKQMGEEIIEDYTVANPSSNAILLRYFNPAGAHESGIIGEAPLVKNTHLVPVIAETAIGERDHMTVHGTDYDTRDGSCVRDYIHVMDIANAHTKAIQYLLSNRNKGGAEVFNIGIGEGVTVLEAIKSFEKHTGINLNYHLGPKREGDAAAIYADNTKAKNLLGWSPQRGIDEIMATAWAWEQVLHHTVSLKPL